MYHIVHMYVLFVSSPAQRKHERKNGELGYKYSRRRRRPKRMSHSIYIQRRMWGWTDGDMDSQVEAGGKGLRNKDAGLDRRIDILKYANSEKENNWVIRMKNLGKRRWEGQCNRQGLGKGSILNLFIISLPLATVFGIGRRS